MKARFCITLCLLLLDGSLLRSQSTQSLSPLTEQIEVSIINVDVTATDRSGKPVQGLTKDDFEILEDGKPQKITNFYSIEGGAPQAERTEKAADPEQFRRRVVVLIDNNFTSKVRRDMAIQVLENFINQQFKGDYEWSILVIGHGVTRVLPFTQDKQQIHDAFAAVRMGGAQLAAQMASSVAAPRQRGTGAVSHPESELTVKPPDPAEVLNFDQMFEDFGTLQATETTAKAVIQTCRAVSGTRGKKVLLLLSSAMDLTGPPTGSSSPAQRNRAEIQRDIQTVQQVMIREANTANVNVYVINTEGISGMIAGTDVTTQAFSDVRPSATTSLARWLATETGGAYLPGNYPAQSIQQVDTLTSNFYSLGYSPTHSEDGRYHAIEVRTKHSGVTLQYRKGYFDLSAEARLEQLLKTDQIFAQNWPLPVTMELGQGSALPNGSVLVPILAKMPLDKITVIPKGANYVGRAHIYISLFDERGTNKDFHHFVQQVEVSSEGLRKMAQQEFKYTMKFGFQPGKSYKIVVAIRDELSKEIGSATQTVKL